MRNKLLLSTLIILSLISSGCSVFMAASGSEVPDLTKATPGSDRFVIESLLGAPLETKATANGSESIIYSYKVGDEAAPGRAALYLVGDILTFGLTEYFFFPLEISQSGNAKYLKVIYDNNQKLRSIEHVKSISTEISNH